MPNPNWIHPKASAVAPDLKLIDDLLSGTRQMQLNRATYLPKYEDETEGEYRKRSEAVANVYGGFKRILQASVGMLFSAPAKLVDADAAIEEHWQDLDRQGMRGDVFCRHRAFDAIAAGIGVLLVDHPPRPDGVVTAATERELALRPYWVGYKRQHVVNWRVGRVAGRPMLTAITLREQVETEDDDVGIVSTARLRELQLTEQGAQWRVHNEIDGEWVAGPWGTFTTTSGAPLRRLPIAIGYVGQKAGPLEAEIPLLPVAEANVDLWRLETNTRYLEDRTCFPQPHVAGELAPDPVTKVPPTVLKLGPGQVVVTTPGSTFSFVEVRGESLNQLRESAREKKKAMAELGLSFLMHEGRQETARAKQIDASSEQATLKSAAVGLTDWYNEALAIHAAYLEVPAPTMQLSPSFDALQLDPQFIQALGVARKSGIIRGETAVRILQRGGLVPEDIDPSEEALMAAAEVLGDTDARREVLP